MFFILYDNWKTLLFMKVYHYSEIFLSAMFLLSLKPVFWKIIETIHHCISPRKTESKDRVHAHSISRVTWKKKSIELESAQIGLFR